MPNPYIKEDDTHDTHQDVHVEQTESHGFHWITFVLGLIAGLVLGGMSSYFLWARPAKKQLAEALVNTNALAEQQKAAHEASEKQKQELQAAAAAKPKMIPMWSLPGNSFTATTKRLYHDGSMDAVWATIQAGAFGPGLPNPYDPDTILAGAVIWFPMSIAVHGKTINADLNTFDENASASATTQEIQPTDTSSSANHSAGQNAVSANGSSSLTNAIVAALNVRASVPTANINAIGTLGPHAPPTLIDALRKEFLCARFGCS